MLGAPRTELAAWCTHGTRGAAVARLHPSPRVQTAHEDPLMLVYVLDVYDPWSYAYLPSVSTFLRAACWLVDVEVVHAHRYAAADPTWLAAGVAEVADSTSTVFGEPFLEALRTGLVVDPVGAGAALISLLATDEVPAVNVIAAVQHEFFVEGRPLEAPGVLRSVAEGLGLDADAVELFGHSDRARELAAEDSQIAHGLGAGGGPLLMASHGERVFEFDGLGATSERLVDQFRSVLSRP